MKKIILLIKSLFLISSALFYAFSYSSEKKKIDCYAQFFDSKKSVFRLPEDQMDRMILSEKFNSYPKKYADMLNLPNDRKIRKQFFKVVREAMLVPIAEEVYPTISEQTNRGITKTKLENVQIKFRRIHNNNP